MALVLYQRSTQLAADSRDPIGSRVDDRRYAPTPSAARSFGPGTRLDDEEISGCQSFNPTIFELAYVGKNRQHEWPARTGPDGIIILPLRCRSRQSRRISVSTGQMRKPSRSREVRF